MRGGLGLGNLGEGHDDEAMADLAHVGGGAVEAGDAGASDAGDGVGLESVAVVKVRDEDFLVGAEADGVHEVFVDGEGTQVLKVGLGDAEVVELGVEEWAPRLAFDGGREFLLELDPGCSEGAFHDYERTIFELQGLGYDVIIAHPERCRAVQRDVELAANLARMGCKLQASADFIAGGRLGRERRPAKRLFKRGLYSYVASDAHRPEHYELLARVLKKYPMGEEGTGR